MEHAHNQRQLTRVIKDQRQITSCAIDVIKGVKKRRGNGLQPRDRMALKLLTPKNSALIIKNGERNLGCRQITFDIVTDDLGRGVHRLVPVGLHVLNTSNGWWSDQYGTGQFLWNLWLKEDPDAGMARILQHLFKFKLKGLFGPKANIHLQNDHKTIAGQIDKGLRLYIQRDAGRVETTLKRLINAKAIHSPADVGLKIDDQTRGYVVLLFGKENRFGVSFGIEKL